MRPASRRSGRHFTLTLMVCASLPVALSWLTIMSPSAGVCANSVLLTFTVSVADPFGAMTSNMPVLIAGENALNDAVPFTGSTVLSVRPNATAWYVNRGLAADRHGEPGLHSCEMRAGSTIVLLSVGASA